MPKTHNKLVSRIEELEKELKELDNQKKSDKIEYTDFLLELYRISGRLDILKEWQKREQEILQEIEKLIVDLNSFNDIYDGITNKEMNRIIVDDLKKEIEND